MLSVFIHAPLENRIEYLRNNRDLSVDAAKALIKKSDRQRANYYNFYADSDWGAASSYDITINSGKLGIARAIDVLAGVCEHL